VADPIGRDYGAPPGPFAGQTRDPIILKAPYLRNGAR